MEWSTGIAAAAGAALTAVAQLLREVVAGMRARREAEERALEMIEAARSPSGEDVRQRHMRSRIMGILRRGREARDDLEEVRAEHNAIRVMLLCAHNGGGDLAPHRPTYSSLVDEAARELKQRRADQWTRERLDAQYWDLLYDLLEDDATSLLVADMKEGKLKNLYLADGVLWAHLRLVHVEADGIWYVAMVSDAGQEPDIGAMDRMRALATRMQLVLGLRETPSDEGYTALV